MNKKGIRNEITSTRFRLTIAFLKPADGQVDESKKFVSRFDDQLSKLLGTANEEIKKSNTKIFLGDPDEDMEAALGEYIPPSNQTFDYEGFLVISTMDNSLPDSSEYDELDEVSRQIMDSKAKEFIAPQLVFSPDFSNAPQFKVLLGYIEENYILYTDLDHLFS
jgi:hypothetical protein